MIEKRTWVRELSQVILFWTLYAEMFMQMQKLRDMGEGGVPMDDVGCARNDSLGNLLHYDAYISLMLPSVGIGGAACLCLPSGNDPGVPIPLRLHTDLTYVFEFKIFCTELCIYLPMASKFLATCRYSCLCGHLMKVSMLSIRLNMTSFVARMNASSLIPNSIDKLQRISFHVIKKRQ